MGLVHFGEHRFDAKLVAFDKDGTLFDFNASWRRTFLQAVESLLAPLSNRTQIRAALYRALGFDAVAGTFNEDGPFAADTSEATVRAAATALLQLSDPPLPWDECEELVRRRFAPILADPVDLSPVTALAPLFSSLHENCVRVAVITSDDSGPTEAALARFRLSRFVDFIACGDGAFRHKPAPDPLLAAAKAVDVSMAETVVVGDAQADLRMARSAGAGLAVGVLTGVGSRSTLGPLADLILDSVSEIRVVVSPPGEQPPVPDHSSDRPDEP
ncbi:MAG: HAD family hydrolase [Caldilineaceae bacterium SB0661_bin_32]|uniref:HAD family hydrolase n=1 Tax=Caldilineaceae bacterium SB0661_bin_32 TaxID=2605255 RepID=A0A6B1DBV6_9CHLR|nr:HAD family hydrolase [Caldilineaceae bacterium SB0661_bin_32]